MSRMQALPQYQISKKLECSRLEQVLFAADKDDHSQRAIIKVFQLSEDWTTQANRLSELSAKVKCIPSSSVTIDNEEIKFVLRVRNADPQARGIVQQWKGGLTWERMVKVLRCFQEIQLAGLLPFVNVFQLRDLILVGQDVEVCCLSLPNPSADDWTHVSQQDLLFLSPESIMPSQGSSTTDRKEAQLVYALGSVFYEIIAQRPLMNLDAAIAPMRLMQQIVQGKIGTLKADGGDGTEKDKKMRETINSMLKPVSSRPTLKDILDMALPEIQALPVVQDEVKVEPKPTDDMPEVASHGVVANNADVQPQTPPTTYQDGGRTHMALVILIVVCAVAMRWLIS
jgi:hypothetical protein